jgi:hypothetical protein
MTPSFVAEPARIAAPLLCTVNCSADVSDRPESKQLVGQTAHDVDAENEKHAAACGWLSLRAYAAYEAFGCEEDRAEARRWGEMRDQAVRARSPAQVARMEKERGLLA